MSKNQSVDNKKYNAQKHGILRDGVTESERGYAEALHSSLLSKSENEDPIYHLLIENLVMNFIRIKRVAKSERELFEWADSKIRMTLNDFGGGNLSMSELEQLSIFSRYQTSAENRIYRAIPLINQFYGQN